MSSFETPFCYIFMYYYEDKDLNKRRIEMIDLIVSRLLDYIDVFAYEYKWDEDKIKRLTPVKRQELYKRIEKRHEKGGGENAFGV